MPWDEVMHKWKTGQLHSGSGGTVKSQDQAVAIMLSEKRKAQGGKSEYQGHPMLEHARRAHAYGKMLKRGK